METRTLRAPRFPEYVPAPGRNLYEWIMAKVDEVRARELALPPKPPRYKTL